MTKFKSALDTVRQQYSIAPREEAQPNDLTVVKPVVAKSEAGAQSYVGQAGHAGVSQPATVQPVQTVPNSANLYDWISQNYKKPDLTAEINRARRQRALSTFGNVAQVLGQALSLGIGARQFDKVQPQTQQYETYLQKLMDAQRAYDSQYQQLLYQAKAQDKANENALERQKIAAEQANYNTLLKARMDAAKAERDHKNKMEQQEANNKAAAERQEANNKAAAERSRQSASARIQAANISAEARRQSSSGTGGNMTFDSPGGAYTYTMPRSVLNDRNIMLIGAREAGISQYKNENDEYGDPKLKSTDELRSELLANPNGQAYLAKIAKQNGGTVIENNADPAARFAANQVQVPMQEAETKEGPIDLTLFKRK